MVNFLTRNGQALLPMVELIEHSQLAVDELIDVLGRAAAFPHGGAMGFIP